MSHVPSSCLPASRRFVTTMLAGRRSEINWPFASAAAASCTFKTNRPQEPHRAVAALHRPSCHTLSITHCSLQKTAMTRCFPHPPASGVGDRLAFQERHSPFMQQMFCCISRSLLVDTFITNLLESPKHLGDSRPPDICTAKNDTLFDLAMAERKACDAASQALGCWAPEWQLPHGFVRPG